jgi:hypothetical protein
MPQLNHSKTTMQMRLEKLKPHFMLRRRGEVDGLGDTELAANASILVFAGGEITVACNRW